MNLSTQKHWRAERDEENIVWLTLDKQNSSVNTLASEVLEELDEILHALKTLPPKGVVIQSGKKNGFIAGADISAFRKVSVQNEANSETIIHLMHQGQAIFTFLEQLPFPTVALINGFCLGGGLELALACRYRVAVGDPKTKLGFPEVKLGIHPGWGGTIRLPRQIGPIKAMDLILSGRTVDAKTAFKMGLVDVAVPKRHCLTAARFYIQQHPKVRTSTFFERLPNASIARPFIGKLLQKKLNAKITKAHYPAPFAVVENWVQDGPNLQFKTEAKSAMELAMTDTARNLVRVFDLQEKLKNVGREVTFKPEHVHVVGAGVMGGDIAAYCVLKGMRVSLEDQNNAAIAMALKRALALFQKRLKEPHLVKAAQDRLMPDKEGEGIKKADLIIEAIIEQKDPKQALFKRLEREARSDAVLATNTSTLPLEEITELLKDPKRVIGLHFFNPVDQMMLVEVVSNTMDSLPAQKGKAFVHALEKLPLPVKSSPGFLVNRILMPYILESMLLLEEGVPASAIDKVAEEFGMPVGPLTLADIVGLDVCFFAAKRLNQSGSSETPPTFLHLYEQNHLGKKTGQGFYRYKEGKLLKENLDKNYRVPEDTLDRLILRMANEAVATLREQVVEDGDHVDAGLIFGIGFPPFRGGLMHYIKEQGESLMVRRLQLLAQRYGDRFLPDKGWKDLQ